ncbi:site-specific integrase [Salinactinospora qingdaonensis]|uniref:site-specific integrase n=1 Tax=Salinactinospora qingdaonensis TaxID=702744 RepID=UPI0031E9C507
MSQQTQLRYHADMQRFRQWCHDRGLTELPATDHTVAGYVSYLSEHKSAPATIKRALTSIRHVHRGAGVPPPTCPPLPTAVDDRPTVGIKGARSLRPRELKRLIDALDGATATGLRDRALLLTGFFTAAWPADLLRVDLKELLHGANGVVLLGLSPGGNAGEEEGVFLPAHSDPRVCPATALWEWRELLAARGILAGPIFRRVDRNQRVSGESDTLAGQSGHRGDGRLTVRGLSDIVRRRARHADLTTASLSATSLRAGALATALAAGYTPADLAAYTRYNPANHALTLRLHPQRNHRNDPRTHGLALLD